MTRAVTQPVALVMAKVPVAGHVKTRLAATVGHEQAARLALAALLDTLDVCEEAFGHGRRYLALAGDLDGLDRAPRGELGARFASWHVIDQRGPGLADRLEHAHADVHRAVSAPVVQVGMDTPHLDAAVLGGIGSLAGRGRPVLGPAVDGGWWVLASTEAGEVEGLRHVPMSTGSTGADTLAFLRSRRHEVVLAPRMTDVDDARDAELAARRAPLTRFATVWREVAGPSSGWWAS